MKKILSFAPYFLVFILLTSLSYWAFATYLPASASQISDSNTSSSDTTPTPKKSGILVFEGPKTAVCPLNGAKYSEEEKALWEQKRPLLVMIENHEDSRPQSGLQNADIVYEAVAEGGITRFMGVFYCAAQQGSEQKYDVGPVRSARTYFLDLASEYSDYPLYTHVGGANCSAATPGGPCTTAKKAQAIEQIAAYGWNNKGTWGDLSQFSLSYKVCRREPERTGDVRATEHTMYCSTTALWSTAADRGLSNKTEVNKTSWDKNFKSWAFTQADKASSSSDYNKISFDFWSGYKDYSVTWEYDQSNNLYRRSNGGQPHVDFNTGSQITAKNLVVQYAKESRSIDEHGHNLYDVIGTGTGYLYQNGSKIDITWSKSTRTSRTIFKDKSTGKEVNFVPGNIWIEILPLGNTVDYEN